MRTFKNISITVDTTVDLPVEKVWQYWTLPEHITQWCQASDDWHAPYAENDVRLDGKFKTTMAARDGSTKFDFEGVYTDLKLYDRIEYLMSDGRVVNISFISDGHNTKIIETFEAEDINSKEMQKDGWQAILNNFKKYAENMENKLRLHFEVYIKAPVEKVYKLMLDDEGYKKWTTIFSPGSRFEGSWEKGSRIYFIGQDPEGKEGGMVSQIKENIPNKFVSIEHLGILSGKEEIYEGEEVEKWAHATENYTFESRNGNTLVLVDTDTSTDMDEYFRETWPKALDLLKEMCEEGLNQTRHHKIYPCLWFNGQAKAAVLYYSNVFGNSRIIDDTPMVVTFELHGERFMALNGGPMFTPNPSISFYVVLESPEEVEEAWNKLLNGGSVLMPLDKYPWSEKYGWVQDRFGISWQLSYGKMEDVGQKFSPVLLFTNAKAGRAEEAVGYYTGIFDNSSVAGIAKYAAEENDVEGYVKHAQFRINNYVVMAMDSSLNHRFDFNEAISLLVECDTQEEIDNFWDKLTAGGGEESMCGWLKDKYGVSWQIIPSILPKLMADPDKADQVTEAFLKMKKMDIEKLISASNS
jgi:predicted 3-demethylubiquinone-9 3-methyltransferase (glyoxalase superfamily)/uncharacterized protein YndB with AHSA1/START domain